MSTTKLKVPTEVLLEKLEAAAKTDAERVRKGKVAHAEALKTHRKAVASALRKEASRIEKGGKYGDFAERVSVTVPRRPLMPTPDGTLQRDLRVLRSSSQPHVMVEPGDHWSRYL